MIQYINVGGEYYSQNCTNEVFFNNVKNGWQYLIATNLISKINTYA